MTRKERIGMLLASARLSAKKSQDFMAEAMNKGKRTITNWETGKSCPTLDEVIEWYEVLGLNPIPSFIALMHSDIFWSLNTDKNIDKALNLLIANLSEQEKRELIFLLSGKHGSDAYGTLQLTTAYLHLALGSKVPLARLIYNEYVIQKEIGVTVCDTNVSPDLETLDRMIESAKEAAVNKKNEYFGIFKGGE